MKNAFLAVFVLLAGSLYAQSFVPVAYWEFQHPEPQGNNLRSVKMIDSLTYVAVGDGGSVVRTSDNGGTWKVIGKAAGTSTNLVTVDFGTASTGIAAGGATVLFTNDTGNTWRRVTISGIATIYRVYYVNPSRVFCVGKDGAIVLSVDSGKTWKPISLESNDDLRDVHFFNIQKGIVCATNGFRFVTSDSGKTWGPEAGAIANNLYALDFVDANNGVFGGELGAIFLTKDGGNSLTKQQADPQGSCNDVVMLSPERAIAVCDYRAIYMTTNGGTSWANTQPYGSSSLKGISFAGDKKNGVIVGSNGIIMRTYNAGDPWEVVFDRLVSDPIELLGVHAIDSMTVVGVGTAGLIVRTTDGGKKWTMVSTPYTESLSDVSFQTPLIGTAVGAFGTILRTRDAGLTWTKQQSNVTETLRGVSFIDSSRGVAVGPHGTIVMTQNGGNTWIKINGLSDTLNFRDVAYLNENRAVVTGAAEVPPPALSSGIVYHTTNGGFAWKQATILQTGTVFNEGYAISFPTPQYGYATGSAGEGIDRTGPVLASVDSGNTWTPIGTTGFANYGMSFANRHSGTAVGLDGRTAHTSDAGKTWVEVVSGTALRLNAVHHPVLQSAFAVGLKTAIIRLTTNDTIVTLSVPVSAVSNRHDMLRSVYPNPAHDLVTFSISVEKATDVMLTLFDVKGNTVASIYEGMLPNGDHEANLDVSKLVRGIYFARLDTPYGSEMMKVIVQ